jgi:hypothetical protein
MHKPFSIKRTVTVFALIFLFQFNALAADTWSTVGSAGTLDEDSTQVVQFDGPYVGFKAKCTPLGALTDLGKRQCTYLTGAIHIRYNIIAASSLSNFAVFSLTTRFRANTTGRILMTLKAENLTTGVETDVITFDSSNFNGPADYQTQTTGPGCFPMNFDQNAYFLETSLTNTVTTTTPSLQSIAIKGCPTS